VKLFQWLRRLFVKPGLYLVFECGPEFLRATLTRYDQISKEAQICKYWLHESKEIDIQECAHWMREIIQKISDINTTHIAVGLDSRWGVTSYSNYETRRHQSDQAITESEIEEIIDHGLNFHLESQRGKLTRLLNASEVAITPIDSRIISLNLDDHSIINPLGLKGARIAIESQVTFVPKEIQDLFYKILPRTQIDVIAEIGVLAGKIISTHASSPTCFLARVNAYSTAMYSIKPDCQLLDQFGWGQENLITAISSKLSLESETARLLITRNETIDMASEVGRRIESYLHPELKFFHHGLASFVPQSSATIYVYAPTSLPPWIFEQRYQSRWWQPWKLQPLSTEIFYSMVGFRIKYKQSLNVKNPVSLLVLLHCQLNGISAEFVQKAIKRRTHWHSSV